jgi:hypothetical protein
VTITWPSMTPKEVRELWAEKLRSDEFIQGSRYLCVAVDGMVCHCVNGVLMELAEEAGIQPEGVFRGLDPDWRLRLWPHGTQYSEYGLLTPVVARWAGISINPGVHMTIVERDEWRIPDSAFNKSDKVALAYLNDKVRMPFRDLANYVLDI